MGLIVRGAYYTHEARTFMRIVEATHAIAIAIAVAIGARTTERP